MLLRRSMAKCFFTVALVSYKTDAYAFRFDRTEVVSYFKQYLISSELGEAITTMTSIYKKVRSHFSRNCDRNTYPLIVNLTLLSIIHKWEAIASIERAGNDISKESSNVLSEGMRFCLFANATYGFALLKSLGMNVSWPSIPEFSQIDLNIWCILKHTGINAEDLVYVNLGPTGTFLMPGYYVAVDHSTRSVVLAVRGTFTLKDSLADLLCDTVPFFDGRAHSGFAKSAYLLLDSSLELVKKQLEKHSGYRLVITGHSMGGSVASLLAIILAKNGRQLGISVPVHCYTYGAAPVFSLLTKVPRACSKNMYSFIHHYDIVSRLCLRSGFQLFEKVRNIDALPLTLKERLAYIMHEFQPTISVEDMNSKPVLRFRLGAKHVTGKNLSDLYFRGESSALSSTKLSLGDKSTDWSTAGKECASSSAHLDSVDEHAMLSIPGKIYWMTKVPISQSALTDKNNIDSKPSCQEYAICRTPHREFEKIMLVGSAVNDHLPSAYDSCLRSLVFRRNSNGS